MNTKLCRPRTRPRPLAGAPATLAALLLFLSVGALGGQGEAEGATAVRLTLEEAMDRALENNARLLVARAGHDAARADVISSTSRLLPRLEGSLAWNRTSDPVGAFGTKLRQGEFGEADFAPGILNDPAPITDWSPAAELSWAVVDLSGWAGRDAARSRARAAGWGTAWTREAVLFETRALYYDAVRASGERAAARAARDAAGATLDLFARRREQGLLTDADVLQAEAELEAARARIAAAEDALRSAREALALHIGLSAEEAVIPAADSLPWPPEASPDPIEEAEAAEGRPDLRRLAALESAAEADVDAAGRRFLPVLELFGGWSAHSRDFLSSGQDDWSGGLRLRWTAFAGLSRPAALRAAEAARRAAATERADARRRARAEVRRAERALEVAATRVAATRAAARAADRGRLLVRRRFEEGHTTPAALLQAEARATDMRRRALDALAGYHVARARLDLVTADGHEGEMGGTDER